MQKQSKGRSPTIATDQQQLLLSLTNELLSGLCRYENRLKSPFSVRPSASFLRRHNDKTDQIIGLLIEQNPQCPRWASRAVDQLLYTDEQLQEDWG